MRKKVISVGSPNESLFDSFALVRCCSASGWRAYCWMSAHVSLNNNFGIADVLILTQDHPNCRLDRDIDRPWRSSYLVVLRTY